jgi:pSer/pThr/pTyr-binding forkhead associated (FHA) protein
LTGVGPHGEMTPMAKPIKCEVCGRENDPSLISCLDCGRPLQKGLRTAAPGTCKRCGAAVLPGYRFCGQCGAEVASTDAPPVPPVPPAPPAGTPAGRELRICTVRTDGSPGASFPLRPPRSVCGRLEGEIRFGDDTTISPRHAAFHIEGDKVTVEDLGSVNGTFIRIKGSQALTPGEEVRLGRQLLRVERLPRPAEGASEAQAWGPADPGFKLRLAQLLDGGGLGEIHPLREGENVIGREAGDVVFPADRYVSARHARIDLKGEAVTVTDLGSSNGTFRRIAGPTAIAPGDQLLIGAQLLKLEL